MRIYYRLGYIGIDAVEDCMAALSLTETQLPTHQQLLLAKKLVSFDFAFDICSLLLDIPHEVIIAMVGSHLRRTSVQATSTPHLVTSFSIFKFLNSAKQRVRRALLQLVCGSCERAVDSLPKKPLKQFYRGCLPQSISNLDMRCLIIFIKVEQFAMPNDEEYMTAMKYLVARCSEYFKTGEKTKAEVIQSTSL